jgi:LmbE family N-acetylglucosaminyl deacetylase
VVFVTNGDGFGYGVDRYYRRLHASRKDALNYGKQRQQEALAADAALGIKPDDVMFLGFPDRGTYPIWRSYWDQSRPYTSGYTGQSQVPYRLAVAPGEPYTAPALLQTLETIIEEYRPTDIYMTDTSDLHPDHLAAGAFTLAAVAELEREDPSFRPDIYTFVIHSSAWQLLPSLEKGRVYVPPSYFLEQGNGWYRLPLTENAMKAKARAIAAYKSQEMVIASFMGRFEAPDELFCLLGARQVASLSPGSLANGVVLHWPDAARISYNPAGNTSANSGGYISGNTRSANPGASPGGHTRSGPGGGVKANDLRAAYLARSGNDIYLRINTLGMVGTAADYTASVYLLPGRTGGTVRRFTWRMTPNRKQVAWLARPGDYDPSGVSVTCSHNQMDIFLPQMIAAGDAYLMFNDDTIIEGIPVAQVPWCLLKL